MPSFKGRTCFIFDRGFFLLFEIGNDCPWLDLNGEKERDEGGKRSDSVASGHAFLSPSFYFCYSLARDTNETEKGVRYEVERRDGCSVDSKYGSIGRYA